MFKRMNDENMVLRPNVEIQIVECPNVEKPENIGLI
jgi:hypothetical protein